MGLKSSDILTPDDLVKMYSSAKTYGARDYLVIRILAETGMKVSEVADLTIKSFNFNDKTVKVVNNKGNRVLEISDELSRFVGDNFGTTPAHVKLVDISIRGIQRIVQLHGVLIGKRMTPELFRDYYIRTMRENGATEGEIKSQLGLNSFQFVATRIENASGTKLINRSNDNWHLYFIRAGETGAIKIGITRDIEQRLGMLQTGSSEKLKVLLVVETKASTESELHKKFAEYRIRGEWFEPDLVLLKYIEDIKPFADREAMAALENILDGAE